MPESPIAWVTLVAAVAVAVLAMARWARVAQREHYEAGRVTRMAWLWSRRRPVNALLWLVAAGLCVSSLWLPAAAVAGAVALALWPIGLGVRGRTSRLHLTWRVRRLLIVCAVVLLAVLVLLGARALLLVVVLAPALVDLVLLALAPVEARLSRSFVRAAQDRLRRVRPRVVAITGSYGKTTTKNYVDHLSRPALQVVMSPASFNNTLGLTRAVNQGLVPGTEVFVAEMGTYGPGEIRRLCELFPPDVAVITTIGEAHLERMGSRATIVEAKSEILDRPPVVVLNVDVPELAVLAQRLSSTKRVISCSTQADGPAADVRVVAASAGLAVSVDGVTVYEGPVPEGAHADNIACAVGAAVALGVAPEILARQLPTLPSVDHRATVQRDTRGVWVIDDTYNANPEGAARALRSAVAVRQAPARVWVITPGMIELGAMESTRNEEFAREVAGIEGSVLCAVGYSNRRALVHGAGERGGEVRWFRARADAVAEVNRHVQSGDVLLFENDLPDHYP